MALEETEFERGGQYSGTSSETENEQAEYEAAGEIMRMSHETELDHFLPLLIGPLLSGLKALAPVVMKAAVPVLKSLGTQALASVAGGAQDELWRGRRRRDHEQENETEWGWRHRYGGGPWRWRHRWLPRPPIEVPEEAQENFLGLGKLVGGLFGETESEQEDFLLGKLLGGIMGEVEHLEPDAARHTTARWFVRFARHVARLAAASVMARKQSGKPLGPTAIRRIVYEAVHSAAQRPHGHVRHRRYDGSGGHWTSDHDRPHYGEPSGRWVRHGSRIIVHM